jgi:uncharacterized protein YndB with AHSA1/START domain
MNEMHANPQEKTTMTTTDRESLSRFPSDKEIEQIRLLKAPRDLVWTVCTEGAHLVHWWGPNGFTIEGYQGEVKKGGAVTFMMIGPDGTRFPNRMEYLEVQKPEKLVYKHGPGDEKGMTGDKAQTFLVTITFEARGDKTFLCQHSTFASKEACDFVKSFGAVELGRQTLDKLEGYLARQ